MKKKDKISYIFYAVIALILLYFAACLGYGADNSLNSDGSINFSRIELDTSKYALVIGKITDLSSYAFKVTIGAALAIGLFFLYQWSDSKNKRYHRKGEEHGSARWAKQSEIARLADKGRDKRFENKKRQIVIAKTFVGKKGVPIKFTIDNNAILTQNARISLNTRQHFLNLNMLIVGGAGSGKSWRFVKPNIAQLNTSYIVTDPKGLVC